jgi:hypothetical protein
MAKKQLLPLVFVDTNILLDFYRFPQSDLSLKLLKAIDENHPNLIVTAQVAMEFKKNRQSVIVDTLSKLQKAGGANEYAPVFLADTKLAKGIKKSNEEIRSRSMKLRQKIKTILGEPTLHDKVYQTCQRLFLSSSGEFNLNRQDKRRFHIRRLAHKRYILGYPPRKRDDTSIGDAINWEWIVDCSVRSGRDVIIVSRDSDYGVALGDEMFLNDWLYQEFKERVSKKRQIILTRKLTHAFRALSVKITKQEEEQESEILDQVSNLAVVPPELDGEKGRFLMRFVSRRDAQGKPSLFRILPDGGEEKIA